MATSNTQESIDKVIGSFKNLADLSDSDVQQKLANVRRVGQRVLLHTPRPGVMREYARWLAGGLDEQLVLLAANGKVPFDPNKLPSRDSLRYFMQAELWREAELLTLAPHTFEALRQVSELQQLIAFTAVEAVMEAGAPKEQLGAVQQMAHTIWEKVAQEELCSAANFVHVFDQVSLPALHLQHYNQARYDSPTDLLMGLTPHMRLALAAEVAAGMLCPGQPPPPDTPEHGAILKLFMRNGFKQLHREVTEAKELVAAADTGAAPKQARLHRLWAHAARQHSNHQQQQQHSSSSSGQSQQQQVDNSSGGDAAEHGSTSNSCSSYSAMLPPPSKVRTWPLSSHIDLQLQVPPGLLLQHAARLAMAAQQQEEQEQQAADRGPSQAVQQLLQALEQQLPQHEAGEVGIELSDLQALFAPSSVHWLQSGLEDTEQQIQMLLQRHGAGTSGSSTPSSSCTPNTDGEPQQHLNGPALPLAVSSSSKVAAAPVIGSAATPAPGSAAAASSHSSSGAAAGAAAAAPAAQAVSAWAGQAGVLPEMLCECASRLAARCLLELLVAEPAGSLREQALPLQALQLMTAVRQLEAAAAAAAAGAGASDCNPAGSQQQQGRGTEAQQAAQLGLVEQALMLLQHITQLRDAAAEASASQHAAAPDVNRQPSQDELQRWHSCSSGGSSEGDITAAGSTTHMDAMPPHQFFAAHGPLSGVNAGVETVGRQLDEPAVVQACFAPPVATIKPAPSSISSHAENSSGTPEDSRDTHHHASSQHGDIHRVLHAAARNASARLAVSRQLSDNKLLMIAVQLLEHCLEEDKDEMMMELAVNGCLWERAGMPSYDPYAWCGAMCEGITAPAVYQLIDRRLHQRQMRSNRRAADRASSSNQCLDDNDDSADMTDSSDSEIDEDSCYAWGTDPTTASSSSNRSRLVGVQEVFDDMGLPTAGRSLRQAEHQAAQQGGEALRRMANKAAGQLAPLQAWHGQQLQRQQEAAAEAHSWSVSRQRGAAALAAAMKAHAGLSSVEPAAATADAGNTTASSRWSAGLHDHHQQCPICQRERQQELAQQQPHAQDFKKGSTTSHKTADSSSSSSGSGGSNESGGGSSNLDSSWPVAYDDPFLWRRLMWKLLGKLSPQAQAFYAHYLALCPHCNDIEAWKLVMHSMQRCLWSPPDADLMDIMLYDGDKIQERSGRWRKRLLRQHARALNTAYLQVYNPAITLLSKQVLLALSPLHHQLLPPAEVAHYLPSSFVPSLGKAVMQQLLHCCTPVLSSFEHDHCRLQLWHVWWHVGLRRYRELLETQEHIRQQWQQLVQSSPCQDAESSHCHSSSGSSSSDLYLDADARLFAAGYATRQLLLGLGAETEPTPASATASSKAAMTLRSFLDRLVLGKLCTDHVALGNSIAPQPRALQRALIREVLPIAAMPAHPGYLQEAVGAPWDTLVPLLQQRGARPLCSGYRYRVHHLMHSAGQVYMQFGDPERWQRHRGGVLGTSSSEESGGPDSVQGDEAAEATWAGSAASSLVCQDPVPVECLQHPELWWTWHQELFSFGSCDVCERGQAGDKMVLCPDCDSAVYCSRECQQADQQHLLICHKLVDAKRRYSLNTTQAPLSSRTLQVPGQQQQQPGGQQSQRLAGLPAITGLLQPSALEASPLRHLHGTRSSSSSGCLANMEDTVYQIARMMSQAARQSREASLEA